ncbi:MAG TPA: large conductance mechanosensitive channel protein MscL [Bacilli bacterium]|nr:large conductance mechanosensitive channel protein MscL [Bacilli bacterium]
MLNDYKKFIVSRNVLDWTIGIVLGTSFAKIVDSFVQDILLPPLSMVLGKVTFRELFVSLSGQSFATLKEAQAAGAPTINYGLFTHTVLDFLVDSLIVFLVIRRIDRAEMYTEKPEQQKECSECVMKVSIRAKKCPYCQSVLV